ALFFIKKYSFNRICFVARPHPPMTYFKRGDVADGRRVRQIDLRVIDIAMDPPLWHHEQAWLVARHSVEADFSWPALEPGAREASLRVIVLDTDGKTARDHRLVSRYGIRGLDCGAEAVVELAEPAGILDLEVAHFGQAPRITVLDAEGRV